MVLALSSQKLVGRPGLMKAWARAGVCRSSCALVVVVWDRWSKYGTQEAGQERKVSGVSSVHCVESAVLLLLGAVLLWPCLPRRVISWPLELTFAVAPLPSSQPKTNQTTRCDPLLDPAVEPGSATETIVKTGPGVFTRAVMAWMVASAAGESGFGANGEAEECVLGRSGATSAVHREIPASGSGCSDGNGGFAGTAAKASSCASSPLSHESHGSAGTTAATTAPSAAGSLVMMVLPPSYLYPVPNNAVAATEGSLVGDGSESGVRERAGDFFSAESLAAHLWGRSWQGKDGKPKS